MHEFAGHPAAHHVVGSRRPWKICAPVDRQHRPQTLAAGDDQMRRDLVEIGVGCVATFPTGGSSCWLRPRSSKHGAGARQIKQRQVASRFLRRYARDVGDVSSGAVVD